MLAYLDPLVCESPFADPLNVIGYKAWRKAGGLKRLSISSTGGSLHGEILSFYLDTFSKEGGRMHFETALKASRAMEGTWSSESIISASDERLKSGTKLNKQSGCLWASGLGMAPGGEASNRAAGKNSSSKSSVISG